MAQVSSDASATPRRKIEIDRRVSTKRRRKNVRVQRRFDADLLLKLVQHVRRRRAQDVVNFTNLIDFIASGKQRFQRDDLEHHAARRPNVHLVSIKTVG